MAVLMLALLVVVTIASNANLELLRQRPEGVRGWPAFIGGLAGTIGVMALMPRLIGGLL